MNKNINFVINKTAIKGLLLISYCFFPDERGSLEKDYEKNIFKNLGIKFSVTESFYTKSKKNVIRAHHFQSMYPQDKLIRVISGKIWDIVIDLRKNSETYGKYETFYLSDQENKELFIPKGLSHGYLVLEESIVSYKCQGKFYQKYDSGIKWDDFDLDINWPIKNKNDIIISEKDKNLMSFKEFKKINKFRSHN